MKLLFKMYVKLILQWHSNCSGVKEDLKLAGVVVGLSHACCVLSLVVMKRRFCQQLRQWCFLWHRRQRPVRSDGFRCGLSRTLDLFHAVLWHSWLDGVRNIWPVNSHYYLHSNGCLPRGWTGSVTIFRSTLRHKKFLRFQWNLACR